MTKKFAVLHRQATVAENCSSETEVLFLDDLHGQFAIELVGLESKLKILQMKRNETPMFQ